MPELCLLMFMIGGCYVWYKFFIRFFSRQVHILPFKIPSKQDFQVAWGFVFYGFAIFLFSLNHHFLIKTTALIIALGLLAYAIYLLFYYRFFCGGFCCFEQTWKKHFTKQLRQHPLQLDNSLYLEALYILGLSVYDACHKEKFENQYQKITSTLQKRSFYPQELENLVSSAYLLLKMNNKQ